MEVGGEAEEGGRCRLSGNELVSEPQERCKDRLTIAAVEEREELEKGKGWEESEIEVAEEGLFVDAAWVDCVVARGAEGRVCAS